MRLSPKFSAMAVGAAIVWFTHPTEGQQRRDRARRMADRAESTARETAEKVTEQVTGTSDPLPPTPATLTEVIDAAARAGYGASFTVTPDAKVRCGECGHESDPADVERAWMHRLEGTSDPDELVTVSALRCPSCGAKGTLVLPFGPNADPVEGDVSRQLREPDDPDMAPLRDLRVA